MNLENCPYLVADQGEYSPAALRVDQMEQNQGTGAEDRVLKVDDDS